MNLDDVLASCMNSTGGGVKITTIPGANPRDEAKTLEELRKLRLLSKEDGEPYKLVFKDHLIWLTKSQWGWFVNARPESVIPTATRTPKTVKSTPGGGLSTEQQSVVDHIATSTQGDVLVIAGPGSGKTKTLVSCIERIVKEGTPGEKIAAISFTNNSAAELKVRLCKVAADLSGLHRVHVSTFHGWVSQLASLHVEPWLHPPIGLQTASLAVALHLRNPDTSSHVFTLTEINAAERHFEGCESFEAMEARNFNKIGQKGSSHESRLGFDNLVKAAGKLQDEMQGCQISTYGSLMKSGIDLAKGLRSGDLQWLFIDEAQDLNSTQADFVRAVQERTGCRVFAIADDDQGIYKFRGASNQFLREFGGNKTTTTFTLSENFRSTRPIVEASLGWIRPNWEKTLHSTRDGLPIVLLTAYPTQDRQRHAQIILEACKSNGLIDAMGEVAALSLSANLHTCYDLHDFSLALKSCTEGVLPQEVLEDFLNHCERSSATGDWHHQVWGEFLDRVKADQKKGGETRFGYPGLRDLYAALEVLRRFNPEIEPKDAARVLRSFNPGEKLSFLGSKPDPDYSGDAINLLSLHSSKGMEFRVVWLLGGDAVIKEKKRESEQGQPNVLGELGAWSEALRAEASTSTENANRLAAEMENRRLLYVGMSRATDLLMISVPPKREKSGPGFKGQIQAALKDVRCFNVYSDGDAEAFVSSISKDHRNPAWSPPHRYRVESFTSLTRQVAPGEEREQEIPCDREFPQPQSRVAMIGDLFHRIMHLLRLEPELIDKRLDESMSDDELIARVSMRTDLDELRELLGNYFSDSMNRPWQWIQKEGSLTEFPFSHVELDGHEEILIKGFIDLAGFAPDGAPDLLVDYKTGTPPLSGSEEDLKHGDQLKLYAKSLSSSYSCTPETITLLNYYVQSQEIRQRS
jgi:superfamily I DNA/RNA helicase